MTHVATPPPSRRSAVVQATVPWRLVDVVRWMAASTSDHVWLDSAVGHGDLGQRSLLALELRPVVQVGDEAVFVAAADGRFTAIPHRGMPFPVLSSLWRRAEARMGEGALGWVGWCAWEAMHFADAALPSRELPFAPVRFDRVAAGLVAEGEVVTLVVEGRDADDAQARWQDWHQRLVACADVDADDEDAWTPPAREIPVKAPDRAWHAASVASILADIHAGRFYQACLTFPLRMPRPHDLRAVYLALRDVNPGDHGVWLRMGDVELASVSPERLLRIDGRRAVARPMKGTRPSDAAGEGARALRGSVKDQAENVMIVDLLRNDLGRVCVAGTVRVPQLFELETYRTVVQMTSTVEGTLREGVGPFDALQAVFPPGSMSGAPRIEACRALAELETEPRGLYAGTVGWIRPGGRADFNVVIRGLQAWGDEARWDVGGGIVADSTPEDEWDEAWAKAKALLALLGRAGQGASEGA